MDCDAIRGRLDVLVGPHTWCGESSHAAIYQDSGMVATAVSSEDPSSETWMSSSAPTHGVGKAPMPLSIKIRAWSLPRFHPRIPPQALT